jgi:hypothetical protein
MVVAVACAVGSPTTREWGPSGRRSGGVRRGSGSGGRAWGRREGVRVSSGDPRVTSWLHESQTPEVDREKNFWKIYIYRIFGLISLIRFHYPNGLRPGPFLRPDANSKIN